jgi:hypothetical protein
MVEVLVDDGFFLIVAFFYGLTFPALIAIIILKLQFSSSAANETKRKDLRICTICQ